MSAIGVHHTATDGGVWDGSGNESNLRKGEGESYYRRAYAWQNPDKDPETKTAYKFIHHFVSNEGEIGAASTRACSAGIAVLNGGRGGADIPDGDRRGVYNHMAAHLRDADMEPPDLRQQEDDGIERRYLSGELRAVEKDGRRLIVGYAAVFEQMSDDLGGFREIVMPGAFTEAVGGDVRATYNHNPEMVLGRTKAGTLILVEDDIGLRYEIVPPDTQYARDMMISIERGDVNQSSFGFRVVEESWRNPTEQQPWPVRVLRKVNLFDVSPVTFPAYPSTSVAVRDMARQLAQAGRATGGATKGDNQGAAGRLALRKRRLQLLEREG